MSLNPDRAFGAVVQIWSEVFGSQGQFRQEPITVAEWQELRGRMTLMIDMNIQAAKGARDGSRTEQTR